MESSFIRLIKKGTSTDRVQKYVFFGVLGIVGVGVVSTMNADNFLETLSFLGVVLLIFGIYYWFNRHKFKPLKFWIDLFENHPEDLIWVKPITTSHNALLVITYSKTYQFQIYLKDGTNTKVDCPEAHKKIFYRMLREHAPHAHLGYSREVAKVYRRHRSRFLARLNEKGLLRTVNDYSL